MNYRFHYLRQSYRAKAKTEPVGCFITSVDENKKTVRYALSIVHPKDKFNKMFARNIASGKLSNGNPTILDGDFTNSHSIVRAVMTDIASKKSSVPKRVRNAAKKWLEFANDTKIVKRVSTMCGESLLPK